MSGMKPRALAVVKVARTLSALVVELFSSIGIEVGGSALYSSSSSGAGELLINRVRASENGMLMLAVAVAPNMSGLVHGWPKNVSPKSTSSTTVIGVETKASQRFAATINASRAKGLF